MCSAVRGVGRGRGRGGDGKNRDNCKVMMACVYIGTVTGSNTMMGASIIYVHCSPTPPPIQSTIKPSCKAFWFRMKRVEYEGLAKVEKRGCGVSFG
jgi:hypothetical protein